MKGQRLPLAVLLAALISVQCASSSHEEGTVHLHSRSIPPSTGIEPRLLEELQRPGSEGVHAIVQFEHQLGMSEYKLLEEELQLGFLDLCGENTLVMFLPGQTQLEVAPLDELVRMAAALRVEDKLERSIAEGRFADWALRKDGGVNLQVTFHSDVSLEEASAAFAVLGREGVRAGVRSWHVVLPRTRIRELAADDRVLFIAQGPFPEERMNAGTRQLIRTDEAQDMQASVGATPKFPGASGQGIQVGICDWGLWDGHADFLTWDLFGNRVDGYRGQDDEHATHVASIAAGNGLALGYPYVYRGHAPEARIGDFERIYGVVDDYDAIFAKWDTNLTNHSYGVSPNYGYSDYAQSIDEIIRGAAVSSKGRPVPARTQVWSAGNETRKPGKGGYFSITSPSKNSITVGSVDRQDPANPTLSSFASMGPTLDGRLKPDVVAPGAIVNDAQGIIAAGVAANYVAFTGTSQAAPAVSGTIALMMDRYSRVEAWHNPDYVLPSTYKAILVHTATDLMASGLHENPDTGEPVVYHKGPDYATGYGLVDAKSACDTIADDDRWLEGLHAGPTQFFHVLVPADVDEFRATLAWDDLPGSTLCADLEPRLVNDLDLLVTDPDGMKYRPWVVPPLSRSLDGSVEPSSILPAKRGADHLNNVEMVSVELPQPGTWTVEVRAGQLAFWRTQLFSLVTTPARYLWLPIPGGELPGLAICEAFPSFCDKPDAPVPRPAPVDGSWTMDPRGVFPLELLRRAPSDWMTCDPRVWRDCDGFELVVSRLPSGSQVVLFDAPGRILGTFEESSGRATARMERTRAGERYFFLVADSTGAPFESRLEFETDFRVLR